jgi:hypothetical protein
MAHDDRHANAFPCFVCFGQKKWRILQPKLPDVIRSSCARTWLTLWQQLRCMHGAGRTLDFWLSAVPSPFLLGDLNRSLRGVWPMDAHPLHPPHDRWSGTVTTCAGVCMWRANSPRSTCSDRVALHMHDRRWTMLVWLVELRSFACGKTCYRLYFILTNYIYKRQKNSSCTSSQHMYIYQVSRKTDNLCGILKREKTCEKPYFSTEFCLVHMPHYESIFHKTILWARNTWRCVCEFFVSFFLYFKMCLRYISK